MTTLIGSACNSESATTGAGADAGGGELTEVSLAVNNPILNPVISSLWIGKYFGWYEEEGIELADPVGTQGAADSTQRVAAGQVDFAPPPPSLMLESAANGQELPVVSIFNWRRSGQYRLAVPIGSTIDSLEDIEGRRIGVSSLGDEGVVYAEAALRELALAEDAAEIVAVGAAGQASEALERGQVEVLALPGAQYALLESLGVELEFLPDPDFASLIFGNHIVASRAMIERSPDIVVGYLRALIKSTIFFIENPEAAIRISFEMYPETVPSGMTVDEAVESTLLTTPSMIETLVFDDKPCQQFGCSTEEEWEAYEDYVGVEVDDVTAFFTNEFIDDANDFDQEEFIEFARSYEFES